MSLRCAIFNRQVCALISQTGNAVFSVFLTCCRGISVSHLILPRISKERCALHAATSCTCFRASHRCTMTPNRYSFKVHPCKHGTLELRPPLTAVICYLNRTMCGKRQHPAPAFKLTLRSVSHRKEIHQKYLFCHSNRATYIL